MADESSNEMQCAVFALCILVILYLTWTNCQESSNTDDKKEGFDPAPYMSFGNDVYQPGLTDEQTGQVLRGKDLSWEESIQILGLEQSVVDSHKAFVSDCSRTTTTASNEPTRSYNPDVVPWVGLRRPDYCGVRVGEGARTVPSEWCDQMPKTTRFLI